MYHRIGKIKTEIRIVFKRIALSSESSIEKNVSGKLIKVLLHLRSVFPFIFQFRFNKISFDRKKILKNITIQIKFNLEINIQKEISN